MSKALTGAAELAGAVGMGALAFFDPAVLALPGYGNLMASLALSGLASEAGAIAADLTANRGQNITTRQPAAFRQVVYGCQRIGGTLIYPSTTGSHKDQYNRVIVLATHQLSAITGLYLDGRLVYWIPGRTGYTTYGNSDFGGDSDGSDHTGPDGTTYNFGDSQVYCEVRFGNQADGDVITGLTANDPAWAPSQYGSPWVGGCAYAYLKIEYNQANFPSDPEIRFTVLGKPVYDPRTGQTGYSHNPALILNDILTDPEYGLNDTTVNQAQLIAAANICEEQVWSAGANADEDRYACHWHYDTGTGIGDIVQTVLATMGGRLCRIGGQWHIFPAAWIAPSATFSADNLTGPVQWASKRAYRELFNEVRGTYTAPNFPYNIAGNYYDANGFANGQIQNNFGFAFQPTNYPAYACDTAHGYAANQYLNQDGGVLLTQEMGFPAVLSLSQAQRLAKIALLRNRQQGSGKLPMNLKAFGLQDCDTFQMTFAQEGWSDKVLEVASTEFKLESGGAGKPPQILWTVGVQETDPSVYEWDDTEEQTVYAAPAMSQASYTVAPPTNMGLVSGAGTALLQPDGTAVPRIEVTWDTPEDILVTQIRMRYRLTGTTAWNDGGLVDVNLNAGYIAPVISATEYDVAIQSVRSSGAASAWVEQDGFTAGLVLNTQQGDGLAPGSLFGEAYGNGTAGILCEPFTCQLGSKQVSYFPGGAVTLTGLVQQSLYYVYIVDPTLAGGNLTPVATLNQADFLGQYFLIGTVVTPYAPTTGGSGGSGGSGSGSGGSGSGQRYYPSSSQDLGTRTTGNAAAAFDGDLSTYATISGAAGTEVITNGDCLYQGDPAIALPGASTLTVIAAVTITGTTNSQASAQIIATVNGTATTLLNVGATTAQATYTCTVPANTPLSSISVEVQANPSDDPHIVNNTETYYPNSVSVSVTEIYVQA